MRESCDLLHKYIIPPPSPFNSYTIRVHSPNIRSLKRPNDRAKTAQKYLERILIHAYRYTRTVYAYNVYTRKSSSLPGIAEKFKANSEKNDYRGAVVRIWKYDNESSRRRRTYLRSNWDESIKIKEKKTHRCKNVK